MASAGYPASSHKGDVITGLDAAAALDDVTVYHAGTALQDGQVVTAGGRVLAVSALGDGFAAARARAYEGVAQIAFDGMQVRPDIAERAVKAQAGELDLFPEVLTRRADRRPRACDAPRTTHTHETGAEQWRRRVPRSRSSCRASSWSPCWWASSWAARATARSWTPPARSSTSARSSTRSTCSRPTATRTRWRTTRRTAQSRGIKVLIGGAGKAAALPGVLAAYTNIPVIGVPIKTSDLGGLDSLLSIVQMPPGVPVACVAINGARNAAILAAKILDV